MMKNIFITGDRQIGKSTLISHILSECQKEYVGYRTLPDQKVSMGYTYVMQDMTTQETMPISFYNGKRMMGIPETFSDLGVRCLKHTLKSSCEIVVLDELGRFEQENLDFIESVYDLLDSEKWVIAVLKNEPISYLLQMKQREDCQLYDLNTLSFEQAEQMIISEIKMKGEEDE